MAKFQNLQIPATGLILMMLPLAAQAAPLIAEFQQGTNEYGNAIDMRLRNQDTLDGSGRATDDADGGDAAVGDSLYALVFMRFDNVFGSEPGQVPYGSEIVSASLDVVTNVSGNAQSGNIFSVSALVEPLLLPDSGTIFATYSNTQGGFGGPDFQDGHTLRPGNPFRSVNVPILTQDQGEASSNDITEVVRYWAAGTTDEPRNHGLVITDTNGTDGWGISSTGNGVIENRPKLRISYYPPALALEREVSTIVFQQGAFNEALGSTYESCVSAWIPDPVSPVNHASFPTLSQRVPVDGSTINLQYLDGVNAAADSPDDQMIIQFKDLFGTGPGQIAIKPNLRIERASLRFTTGPSGSANSPGPIELSRMLKPWYTEDELGSRSFKAFTQFTAPDAPDGTVGSGPTQTTGDLAPVEFAYWGMYFNMVVDADVTQDVRDWAAGEPNYGWNLQQGTSDGWQIYFPGANSTEVRPQLVVTYSYDPDADGDGLPDAWEAANGTNPALADADGDVDGDGLTNKQEFELGTKANSDDTDGDGLKDKAENNTGIWVDATNTGTRPLLADSDGDGLADGLENPALPWTGATQPGSDPNKFDTDGDGFADSSELAFETDPTSPGSVPNPSYQNVMADNFDGLLLNSTPQFLSTLGAFVPEIYDSTVAAHSMVAQLTDATANSNNSVAWDYVDAKSKSIRLSFDYRMSADVGTAEAADGFGIGLFRISAYDESGARNPGAAPKSWEDPRAAGGHPEAVMFSFDIYNGATEGNNVRVTGPADTGTLLINQIAPFPLNNGLFNRVVITGTTIGTSSVFSMEVITDVDGTPATASVFKNLVVPGFDVTKEQFRIISGGRTGTAVVKTELDNVSLAVAATPIINPPTLDPFSITSAGLTADPAGFTLTWESVAGGVYTVESSGTMTGTWNTVGTAITAAGISTSATATLEAGAPPARFYRVRRTK